MFLDIVVKRVEETIDFELSEDTSDILNLEFVGKCEGRYSVSVNMYGVGVKGSPMEVEIRGSNAIIEKIVVVEVETENLKDINTLEGEAVVGDEEIIRQNSLDHETEVVNVPGEAFVEDVSVIEEGNMDYNLDEETIEVLSESENEHEVAVECKTETKNFFERLINTNLGLQETSQNTGGTATIPSLKQPIPTTQLYWSFGKPTSGGGTIKCPAQD